VADFLTTLKSQVLLVDGAMGSYLFELTGRLSEANHVYETFNVDQPGLIEKVHLAYLSAGAQCLVTNTFGANRVKLDEYGLGQRVAELNRGGVEVARRAVALFQAQHPGAGTCFVFGSIGPTQQVLTDQRELEACYRDQIETLVAAGVDALILETFTSLEQLELLINLVNSIPSAPPIIAEMTIHSSSTGAAFATDPLSFITRMAALKVPVAGVNCCAPWDATAFVDAVADSEPVRSEALQLSAMPNGGGFQRIGNRFMTMVNPEFAGRIARRFLDRGVRLIGGCCEMHPPHVQEMHNYLHSRQADKPRTSLEIRASLPPAGDAEKRANGGFSRKLIDGQFVVSVEMLPPRGTDPKLSDAKIDFVRQLAESGRVDALDITDGSRGIPLMPPGDFIQLLRARLGWTGSTSDRLELIPHFTGRDLNVMGIQSRLIGYHANRIYNVLFVTGDPPKMSPTYPRSTAVFDLDSVATIRLVNRGLNAGVDFGSTPLGKHADPRTHFTIGTGFEPEALNPQREMDRLQQKLDAGADYVMTQPAFRHEPLMALNRFRDEHPVLIGVMILSNHDQARRVAQVPGVVVPDSILKRLEAYEQISDQSKAGQEIAIEQIRWVRREGWRGLYLMSPASHRGVADVLQAGLG
jgi:homocysteine S-methyltransferase